MKKAIDGFSAVEVFIVVFIIVIATGAGYAIYRRHHPTTPVANTADGATAHATPGTASDIDTIDADEQATEAQTDKTYSSTEQQDTTDTDSAAAGIGGAYDESSL